LNPFNYIVRSLFILALFPLLYIPKCALLYSQSHGRSNINRLSLRAVVGRRRRRFVVTQSSSTTRNERRTYGEKRRRVIMRDALVVYQLVVMYCYGFIPMRFVWFTDGVIDLPSLSPLGNRRLYTEQDREQQRFLARATRPADDGPKRKVTARPS